VLSEEQIDKVQQEANEAVELFLQGKSPPENFINSVKKRVLQERKIEDAVILAGTVLVRELGEVFQSGSILFENALRDLIDFLAKHFNRPVEEIRVGIR